MALQSQTRAAAMLSGGLSTLPREAILEKLSVSAPVGYKNWRTRRITVRPEEFTVEWRKPEVPPDQRPNGLLRLTAGTVVQDGPQEHCLTVKAEDGRTLVIRTADEVQCRQWQRALVHARPSRSYSVTPQPAADFSPPAGAPDKHARWSVPPSDAPTLAPPPLLEVSAPASPLEAWRDADFSDLLSGVGSAISDAAERAISLEQLDACLRHVERRFTAGEAWMVKRAGSKVSFADTEISSAARANMHDLNAYVLKPMTMRRKCSYVEMVAREAQPPDFFAAHFWGQPTVQLSACLHRHADDRGLRKRGTASGAANGFYLGERSPRYWVCAFAKSPHKEGELSDDVRKTSFFRAMACESCRGVVWAIDHAARLSGLDFSPSARLLYARLLLALCTPLLTMLCCQAHAFTRAWVLLEMFEALATVAPRRAASGYVVDIYTASPHARADRSNAQSPNARMPGGTDAPRLLLRRWLRSRGRPWARGARRRARRWA